MKRIGLLSDTHGYWDDRYEKYFASCDEIWHAGDIGSNEIIDRLSEIAPLIAVAGTYKTVVGRSDSLFGPYVATATAAICDGFIRRYCVSNVKKPMCSSNI